MAFSPLFTVSQGAATPADVSFQDVSTGTDAAITQRRIYITDSDGNPVVPSGTTTAYIQWALGTNPITVSDLLPNDLGVYINIQWLNVANVVLYEADNNYCLDQFNRQFFYYLIQQLALAPATLQDTNYASNLELYWVYIIGAENSVEIGDDIAACQNLLNMATNMMNQQNLYF